MNFVDFKELEPFAFAEPRKGPFWCEENGSLHGGRVCFQERGEFLAIYVHWGLQERLQGAAEACTEFDPVLARGGAAVHVKQAICAETVLLEKRDRFEAVRVTVSSPERDVCTHVTSGRTQESLGCVGIRERSLARKLQRWRA